MTMQRNKRSQIRNPVSNVKSLATSSDDERRSEDVKDGARTRARAEGEGDEGDEGDGHKVR